MIPENDPSLRSFVSVPPESHFPIQNLPLGVFRRTGGEPRIGVAIGELVLDLAEAAGAGLLEGLPVPADFWRRQHTLNELMAGGTDTWRAVRGRVSVMMSRCSATMRHCASECWCR
jgi:fumarylacetoacetase